MDFRDTLTAELPDPGDDEPEGLRADIVDELADHLACSYRRELLRGADPTEARRRVLDRFGDPAAVARRLWFDAMRGKIMSRRILIGYSILLTVICAGLVALNVTQAARLQLERERALIAEVDARMRQYEAKEKLLQQITTVAKAKAAKSPKSLEGTPVTFRLIEEAIPGTPAANVVVRLGLGQGSSSKPDAVERRSDEGGMVQIFIATPGDWENSLSLPYDRVTGPLTATGMLRVVPGTSILKEIICPRSPLGPLKVNPRVDWPEDLADAGLLIELQLQDHGFDFQPGIRWIPGKNIWNVLIGPTPLGARQFGGPEPRFWKRLYSEPSTSPHAHVFVDFADLTGEQEGNSVPPGQFQIRSLSILKPRDPGRNSSRFLQAEVLAFWDQSGPKSIEFRSGEQTQGHGLIQGTDISPVSRILVEKPLLAVVGNSNVWKIRLPEEILREVRKKLKAGSGTS